MHQPRQRRSSGGFQRAFALAAFAGLLFLQGVLAAVPAKLGDLDADGQPTVLDLVRLIGHINGTNLLGSSLQLYGDINEDGVINTNDVTLLQNAILGLAPLPNPYAAPIVSVPVTSTNGTNILITGVARPNRTITVLGGAGVFTVSTDGNGNFSVLVTLQPNRLNTLYLTASNGTFTAGIPQPLRIIQDSEPPSLYLDFPTNNQVLHSTCTVIAGRVGDMLSGFMGLNVWVQSSPAEGPPQIAALTPATRANVNVGVGNNGSFERGLVPLLEGTNLITVTAADQHGNTITRQITIHHSPLGKVPRLEIVSGDMQGTNIHRRLGQAIVVRAVQADGSPFANQLLTLDVTRNDGRLLPLNTNALADPGILTNDITRTAAGVMHLQLFTDAAGEARAWWTLGAAAGCGNNRVCVTGDGLSNGVFFCASAAPAPVQQINIGTGNNQKGEAGAAVTEPLRAWVSDSCNGVESIPVLFRVVSGGGKVNGQEATIVLSTRTGHSEVQFTLGPDSGQNVIEANYPSNSGLPATFIAYGTQRDPARVTSFNGLVLDNTSQPIGGVHCLLSIAGQDFTTATDIQGRFIFTNTPPGPAHLHIDGLPATSLGTNTIPPGSFPALGFATVLIPNVENSLVMPALLPHLNPANALTNWGTNDIVLTCAGMEGLRMTIKAGSMRKVDGSLVTPANPAIVALNQVHHDSVPMPMPDGVASPFAWTLQPGGAHFDPPIAIEYPNMSALPAGALAYFLSFNHDTERFEIVASGHVTEDSSTIVTDPGAGLSIAGWGGNCPPYAVTGEIEQCNSGESCGGQKISLAAAERAPRCAICQDDPNPPAVIEWNLNVVRDDAGATRRHSTAVEKSCGETWFSDPDDKKLEYTVVCDKAAQVWRFRITAASQTVRYGVVTTLPHYTIDDVATAPDCGRLVSIKNSYLWMRSHSSCLNFIVLSDGVVAHELVHVEHLLEFFGSVGRAYLEELNNLTIPLCEERDPNLAKTKFLLDMLDITERFNQRSEEKTATERRHGPAFIAAQIMGLVSFGNEINRRSESLGCGFTVPVGVALEATPVTQSVEPGENDVASSDIVPNGVSLEIAFDESWEFSVGGQRGTFPFTSLVRVRNISAPDLFGPSGPGSTPDFTSDDPVRAIGVSRKFGTNRYAFSEFFQIRQGQTTTITNLTFSDVPPRKPDALSLVVSNRTLRPGETLPLMLVARFADGGTLDVSSHTRYSTYRVSNPNIATVSPDGVVSGLRPGVVYVTAGNEGASTVCGLNIVSSGDTLTTVTGSVVDTNGMPVAGATVRLFDLGGLTITDAAGRFIIPGVPTTLGPISVRVQLVVDGRYYIASMRLVTVPGGQTLAGVMVLRPYAPTITTRFAAGGTHSLAVRVDGALWGWGYNGYGQLGNGTTVDRSLPVPIETNASWQAVSCGTSHSVGLRTNGTLWGWGNNGGGQLGGGPTTNRPSPVPIATNDLWQAVATGDGHTMAIRRDGTLWGWGANNYGQLGDTSTVRRTNPVQVGTAANWKAVAAGHSHTLGLRADGTLWAWGQNLNGQVGDGTMNSFRTSPTKIGTYSNWLAVAAGYEHSMALRGDGTLWAWGRNNKGQLGDGTTFDQNRPLWVGTNATWQGIAAGTWLSQSSVALRSDGTVWAWGANDLGQLGDGTRLSQSLPVQVGTDADWRGVAAGEDHMMALRHDGTLWAWGSNNYGKLGEGGNTTARLLPGLLGGETAWQDVSPGYERTFALRRDGRILGWGKGGVGDGTTTDRPAPVIVTNADWQGLWVGHDRTLALRSNGTLWAWGENSFGQLGDGTMTDRLSPVPIATNGPWQTVSASLGHTLAVRSDGTLWAWGANGNGQIGDGTYVTRLGPVPVATNYTDWQAVAAGYNHSLALRRDGTIWAWGANYDGELGTGEGSTVEHPTPVPVATNLNLTWIAISAGYEYSMGLAADGSLWAWGVNHSGQLGAGLPTGAGARTNRPVRVVTAPNQTWASVSAGFKHTVARATDNTLWTWGYGGSGQLGFLVGLNVDQIEPSPTQVGTNTNWQSASAGWDHTVALRSNGSIWTWGSNAYGKLGDGMVPVFGGPVWGPSP